MEEEGRKNNSKKGEESEDTGWGRMKRYREKAEKKTATFERELIYLRIQHQYTNCDTADWIGSYPGLVSGIY